MERRIKNLDYRIILGILLILGGVFGILEKFGVIRNATDFFWAAVFGLAGLAFLYIFITDREHWWSIIPGSSLIGLAITVGLPEKYDMYGGFAFLGAIGVGFLIVYFFHRKHWWAIIPFGVLTTLGIISSVSNQMQGQDTGALFFIGLGTTFLIVALLPGKVRRMNWAFIPATILLLFGVLLGPSFRGWLDYIWISSLFISGIYLVWRFIRTRNS